MVCIHIDSGKNTLVRLRPRAFYQPHRTRALAQQLHVIAAKQMYGFGGMLSFEVKGGLDAVIRFMRNIKMCRLAPTLGDVDTLILHPASMSHLNVAKEVRERNGITDGLIRLSVGIEHIDDIIADVSGALAAASA